MNMLQTFPNIMDGGKPFKNTLGINPNAPDAAEQVAAAPVLTLRDAVSHALLNGQLAERDNPSGAEKMRRYRLAVKCNGVDNVELAAEEVALIKGLVGNTYGPALVGPVWRALDPAEVA